MKLKPSDLHAEFHLPSSVVDIVRSEEARLATRLADAGLRYEIDVALLAYRRTMVPLLFMLNTSRDPEGELIAEKTQECAVTWSAAETEAVYNHAVSRWLDAIKVATSRWSLR